MNFDSSTKYRVLTQLDQFTVEETFIADYKAPPSERHLQCLWFDSKYRPDDLTTLNGEKVVVENPGKWNLQAGPDFKDATLIVGKEKRRISGDVEIHTSASDWTHHKHSENPLYKNVIAHVFYNSPHDFSKIPTPNIINISMKRSISNMKEFFFDKLDTTAYPHPVLPVSPSPCSAIFKTWTPEQIDQLLIAAGEERLRLKTIRIAAGIAEKDKEQILYEEIMGAMGYKHNSTTFKILANRMPVARLRDLSCNTPEVAYAIMLGLSSLLPAETSGTTEETARFIRQLWDNWWKFQNELDDLTIDKSLWNFAFIRPQNHPERRMAAAAYLFCSKEPLSSVILKNHSDDPSRWFRKTIKDMTDTPNVPFWENYFSFHGTKKQYRAKMLGKQRAASILINVIIPWLAAQKINIQDSIKQIPKEQNNSIIKNTAYMLFGHDHSPTLYNTAIKQQGLLQIYYDFCVKNIPSCKNCSLIDKIKIQTE